MVHAASQAAPSYYGVDPVGTFKANTLGTINTLEFLRKQEAKTGRKGRAIFFSSVTVYNNPTKEDYVAVEDETSYAQSLDAATACYSESKRMSEVIAKSYVKQFGVDAVIARFSTVYGPTRNIPDTAFYEFIKKSIAGEDITVNSNAAPRRDNIYIDDAIEGLLLLTLKGTTGDTYNISSNGDKGNYMAVDEVAQIVASHSHKKCEVVFKSLVQASKAGIKLDNSKLKKLGWDIVYSMDEGVLNTLKQYIND